MESVQQSIGWDTAANIVSVGAFVVLLTQVSAARLAYVREQVRTRRYNTYLAYSEVRDRILKIRHGELDDFVKALDPNKGLLEQFVLNRELYTDTRIMLSQIERLAAAIEAGIFDVGFVARVSRTSLIETYDKLRGFIMEVRNGTPEHVRTPEYCASYEALRTALVHRKAILDLFAVNSTGISLATVVVQSRLPLRIAHKMLKDMSREGTLISNYYGEYRLSKGADL